ncbi:MAG: hypothetical protein AAFV86_24210, partial [Pseudomonadota bacterium]
MTASTAETETPPVAGTVTGHAVPALMAAAVATLGSALAFALAGGFALIGIDDAAITLNYADNLARGNGFVYYAGGERVEGFTSFLWTVIVAGAVLVFGAEVNLAVVAISSVLGVVGLYCALRLAAIAADAMGASRGVTLGAVAVVLLATPSFFFWQSFTMMETPLWTALFLALVLRMAEPGAVARRIDPVLVLAAFCLPLTRPEGIAFTLGLLALAVVLSPGRWRGAAAAGLGALVAFGGLTAFRLSYFGFPFPNTYYAKVSADKVQSIKEGIKYVQSFVVGLPFAEILLLASAVLAAWAVLRRLAGLRGADPLLFIAAGAFGVFASYAVLGGDHFLFWRLIQPVLPLLAIAPALLVALAWGPLRARLGLEGRPVGTTLVATTAAGVCLTVGALDYRSDRFAVDRYFGLVEQGLDFGRLMEERAPGTVIGVGPAGAIALTYEGPIRDLLALNWVEMAHETP